MDLTLYIKPRDTFGTREARRARSHDFLPAVIYGHGIGTTHILIDRMEFERVRVEAGETSFITLVLEGSGTPSRAQRVLIRAIDWDPIRRMPRHVDFYQPKVGQLVRVKVPLVFIGTSPLIEREGGTLVRSLQELEVSALPENIPHELQVGISRISEFGEHLSVKDIELPQGVQAEEDPALIVATILAPVKEEEVVPAPSEGAVEEVKVEAEEKRQARAQKPKEEKDQG